MWELHLIYIFSSRGNLVNLAIYNFSGNVLQIEYYYCFFCFYTSFCNFFWYFIITFFCKWVELLENKAINRLGWQEYGDQPITKNYFSQSWISNSSRNIEGLICETLTAYRVSLALPEIRTTNFFFNIFSFRPGWKDTGCWNDEEKSNFSIISR